MSERIPAAIAVTSVAFSPDGRKAVFAYNHAGWYVDQVLHLAQKYGTVIVARAYAEWNLSTERLSVVRQKRNDRTLLGLRNEVLERVGHHHSRRRQLFVDVLDPL